MLQQSTGRLNEKGQREGVREQVEKRDSLSLIIVVKKVVFEHRPEGPIYVSSCVKTISGWNSKRKDLKCSAHLISSRISKE